MIMKVDLAKYDNSAYEPGRGAVVRSLWYIVNALLFASYVLPLYSVKRALLRLFGARVGQGVVIKPNVNIKYPWNIEIGDHAWLGEGVWLDSIGKISIGSNACLSQGAYICTGNHDWSDTAFGLIVKPVVMEDGVWIGARSVVLPGAVIRAHAVITTGSVVSGETEPFTIYQGIPAKKIDIRTVR